MNLPLGLIFKIVWWQKPLPYCWSTSHIIRWNSANMLTCVFFNHMNRAELWCANPRNCFIMQGTTPQLAALLCTSNVLKKEKYSSLFHTYWQWHALAVVYFWIWIISKNLYCTTYLLCNKKCKYSCHLSIKSWELEIIWIILCRIIQEFPFLNNDPPLRGVVIYAKYITALSATMDHRYIYIYIYSFRICIWFACWVRQTKYICLYLSAYRQW